MERKEKTYPLSQGFKQKALQWADQFPVCCYLDRNGYNRDEKFYTAPEEIECRIGVGAYKEMSANVQVLSKLQDYIEHSNDIIFGFICYDIKNEIENLVSENLDGIKMPLLYFFQPETSISITRNSIKIISFDNPQKIYNEILSQESQYVKSKSFNASIHKRFSKEEYLETAERVKEHIRKGDVYEMTLCQEFYDDNCTIEPLSLFLDLMNTSPAPFACYFKLKDKYLLCASPERFIRKKEDKLISQPIKGTIKRSADKMQDEELKLKLLNDPKEQAENVMIVDLVRNDLSRVAKKGSVKVEEMFGVYSFPQVHQMISTVSCKIPPFTKFSDILFNTFPMGSMTGAPKVKALELIEKFEKTRRGLYSGSVGYLSPEGDFDFNVVIRSILYNKKEKYLSFITGSAITDTCDPEYEYNECLLKASAMMNLLSKKKLSASEI